MVSPELAQIFATRTPATPETAVFAGENRAADQTSLQPIGDWFNPREWQLCAAFAGTTEVLDRYARELTLLAEKCRATSTAVLGDATRPAVWGRLRESLSMLLEASPKTVIFKFSVLPSHHAALFTNLQHIAERATLPTRSSPAPAAQSISHCSRHRQTKTPPASLAIHRPNFRSCFASAATHRFSSPRPP